MDDYCEPVNESDSDGSDNGDDDDTSTSSVILVNTDEEDQDNFVVDDDVIDGVKIASLEKDNSAAALPGQ